MDAYPMFQECSRRQGCDPPIPGWDDIYSEKEQRKIWWDAYVADALAVDPIPEDVAIYPADQ